MHSEWLRCTPYGVRSGGLVCIYQRDIISVYRMRSMILSIENINDFLCPNFLLIPRSFD